MVFGNIREIADGGMNRGIDNSILNLSMISYVKMTVS